MIHLKKHKNFKFKNFDEFRHIIVDGIEYDRYIIKADTDDVFVYDLYKQRFVEYTQNKGGYFKIWLNLINGRKKKALHRVVAETYIPNPDNKPQVNHKDGKKYHNYASNLEWSSTKENIRHSIDTGLRSTVILPEKVHEICKLIEENELMQKDIAKVVGVPLHFVRSIRRGGTWTEISKMYNFPPLKHKYRKTKFTSLYKLIDSLILAGYRNKDIIEMVPIEGATDHNYQNAIYKRRLFLKENFLVITV